MIRAKAGYETVRNSGPFGRANRAAAATPALQETINRVADMVVDETKSVIASESPANLSESSELTTYYNTVQRVDAGVDFPRKKFMRGSTIRVALVSPVGGAASANVTEYGSGKTPGLYPMTKAVLALGGTLFTGLSKKSKSRA
jgi:hypothetical protein